MSIEEGINGPKLIFNCDETNIPLQTKTGKVVCDKLLHSAYSIVSSDKKKSPPSCVSLPLVKFCHLMFCSPVLQRYVLDLPPGTATFVTPPVG